MKGNQVASAGLALTLAVFGHGCSESTSDSNAPNSSAPIEAVTVPSSRQSTAKESELGRPAGNPEVDTSLQRKSVAGELPPKPVQVTKEEAITSVRNLLVKTGLDRESVIEDAVLTSMAVRAAEGKTAGGNSNVSFNDPIWAVQARGRFKSETGTYLYRTHYVSGTTGQIFGMTYESPLGPTSIY